MYHVSFLRPDMSRLMPPILSWMTFAEYSFPSSRMIRAFLLSIVIFHPQFCFSNEFALLYRKKQRCCIAMEEKIVSEEEIVDMADFFKVFGDPTRLRILFVLWENEECSVGAISEKVKMSQSAVSQQLKILRSSRLVRFKKEGRDRKSVV